MPTTETEKF